jgi:peptide/nickel transport system substrate-binding protein
MKNRLAAATAALAAVAVALSGCSDGGAAGTSSDGSVPSTVTIGVRSDVDVFNPFTSVGDIGAAQALRLLYDSLVRSDAKGEIEPGLAESWKVTPTGGTFQLRKGITCSDGTPMSATDVAKSIQFLADPDSGASYSFRVFGYAGAKSIVADDAANTLTIELKGPNNDMLSGLANIGKIVCPKGLEDPKALATTPLGTGPYTLESQKRGESYTFKLRTDYVGYPEGVAAKDMPATVVLRVVPDDSTQTNLLLSNELTVANLQGQSIKRVRGQQGVNEVAAPAWGVTALAVNHDTPVGGDVVIRRAMTLALDPKLYNDAAYGGLAEPASALYTPNMRCYSADVEKAQVRGDVAAAAKLLDDNGYKRSGETRTKPDGSPLTIRMIQLTTNPTEAEYVKGALAKVGLTVELVPLSYNEALASLSKNEWDMITFPFQSGMASPSLYVIEVTGSLKDSLNFGRIDNKAYQEIITPALAATSDAERCELWNKGQEALLRDADLVPLVQVVSHYFAKGVTFEAAGTIDPFSFAAK